MFINNIRDTTKSINWQNITCTRLQIPLFNPDHSDKVHFTDIIQGEIGSCWFLSVLISYLRPNSKNIKERADDIYKSIKIFRQDPERTIYKVHLDGKKIYVDDYVSKSYHRESEKKCRIKCIWFILFEKAMLSLMTHYNNRKNSTVNGNEIYVNDINIRNGEMKAATIGIGYLIPGKNRYFCLHKVDRMGGLNHIEALELYNRFKAGNHIMANTSRWTYPGKKFPNRVGVAVGGAIPTHCYAVIDMNYSPELGTYLLTIQNPWGNQEIAERDNIYKYPPGYSKGNGISIISWERFHHLFACVHLTE